MRTKLLILIMLPIFSYGQIAAPLQKNSKWPIKNIKVCFENADDYNLVYRQWTQKAVEETWERNSQLNFTDWCGCDDTDYNIRIYIDDSETRPHAKALGALLDKLPNGIVLNSQWDIGNCGTLTENKEDCFKTVAVHEFGHAIGFSHEHSDPRCCQPEDRGGSDLIDPTSDDWIVNDTCDENSVMSYCNPLYSNHGQLSSLDIELLQKVYGKPNAPEEFVIISDNFNLESSKFKNYNNEYYSAIKSNNKYTLKLLPNTWGFTWIPFPNDFYSSFSAYQNTALEFDYEVIVPKSNDRHTFGLIFDLHDVNVVSSCIGGNFYAILFHTDLTQNMISSRIGKRGDCQNGVIIHPLQE